VSACAAKDLIRFNGAPQVTPYFSDRDNSQPPAIGNKQHWWGALLARCHRYFDGGMKLVKPAAVCRGNCSAELVMK
jgi:hypothetical protein